MGLLSSALGAFTKGVTGLAGDLPGMLGSSALGFLMNKASHKQSMDAYNQRYQSTAADMKAAGLNPILAASGGFNVGQPPAMQSPSIQGSPSSSSAMQVASTEEMQQKIFKTKNEALESIERASKLRAESKLMTQHERKMVQDVNESIKRVEKMRYEIDNILYDNELKTSQIVNLDTQVKKLGLEMIKLAQVSQIYEGPIGSLLAYISEISKGLGITGVPGIFTRGRRIGGAPVFRKKINAPRPGGN